MKKLSPFVYILPAAIIIVLFRLVPIIISFVISFFEWGVNGMGDFIGLQNYFSILSDNEFWQSMVNTFWLVIFVVPCSLVFSLLFANMLNSVKYLRAFFRTIYFIPTVTSLVAISIVWKIIFNQQSGLANHLLRSVGLDPLGWLAESDGIFKLLFEGVGIHLPIYMQGPSLALFSIILVCIWRSLGYNTIIYLAGLQNIPGVYYEAASIDGASKTRQFLDITVPMVSPTATSPELTTLDDKDYLFRVVPGDDYQGKVLARIVKEDGLDKVAVTYVNNDYGVGIASAFKREFEQAGGTVTGFQAHEENKSSYRSELATLAGGDARALVVVGYAGGSGVTIIRQALENGFFDRFIGTDGMRDALLIQQIGGDNLASTFFTAPASPPESEAQATFAKAYAAAFETTQDKLFIQQAYDALMVLALAIEKAGSTDRDAIRDALRDVANAPGEKILPGEWEKAKKLIADGQDVDYEGAGGPQDFDENGDVAGFIGKYVVENNSFKEVGVY